jgi:hypothetical protein
MRVNAGWAAAFDTGDVFDDVIPAIARFMIERHGWEAAPIAETLAAAHILAREDEGAKLWADVAEQSKRFLPRPPRLR